MKIVDKIVATIEYGVYYLVDEETNQKYTYMETIDVSKDKVVDYELYNQTLGKIIEDEDALSKVQLLVDLSPPMKEE